MEIITTASYYWIYGFNIQNELTGYSGYGFYIPIINYVYNDYLNSR